MKMLNDIMQKRNTLIDYELIVDDVNRRLVAFGGFAGYSGMVNCLSGLGNQLLSRGYRTPFLVSLLLNFRILGWLTTIFLSHIAKMLSEL